MSRLRFIAAFFAALALQAAASPGINRRGATPGYYYDPSTTKYCTWWFDNDGSANCKAVPDMFGATMADFLRWNPLVKADCTNFNPQQSYCVEAYGEPTGPPVSSPTSTAGPPPTSTKGNGITTPTPTQPGMVTNCNKFYKSADGDSCDKIAKANGITVATFISWNQGVGSDCSLMWANAYFCVGVIGFTASPTTSSKAPATTTQGNGITTPLPTQPGMVGNCNKFYKTVMGDNCDAIARANGITAQQFIAWNSGVGTTCASMWSDTYYCIGVVGFTPTSTVKPATTTKGNGVTTPTPIQTGMVTNCKTFHLVKTGETCETIAKAAGITVANFQKWNQAVGPNCTGMWADTWACIGVLS